jgi:hypothetical protein
MIARPLLLAVAVLLAAAAPAAAHPTQGGLAVAFGKDRLPDTSARSAAAAPAARAAQAEPPLTPVPRPVCGPGSRPETSIQGRVPAGSEAGFDCNATLVGQHGSSGGFKTLRFVDKAGHECAYYDTTLLFPSNIQTLSERPTGVAVLDMSDPAKPVQTASLLTPAMQTPHESLALNERRGLLVAVTGNPVFYPGVVDVYDLNADCRNPALQSSLPIGVLGHESGFAPDGNTFYATSLRGGTVTAVDLTDPRVPRIVAVTQFISHGLTVSDDGNRVYIAGADGLVIADTSEIQTRKPNSQFRVVSTLDWASRTIPQVAWPITIGGRPFLVEVDEFSTQENDNSIASNGPKVGAARIIDIADEKAPRVVSNIRLAVHQREHRAEIAGDPGASSQLQGYAGHYCSVPQRAEPGIVACSMIASGLRVFDIRDPYQPKEMAYFVAPNRTSQTAGPPSNYAMSAPAFVPERGEVWYSDGNSGFYDVKLAGWPFTGGGRGLAAGVAAGDCTGGGGFRSVAALPRGRGVRLRFARAERLPVDVDVFQVSQGRRVLEERRVAHFRNAGGSTLWRGRASDGYYFARFTMRSGGRRVDVRRIVLRRAKARFTRVARHYRRGSCEVLRSFKLERPVFGGRSRTPLRIAYRLSRAAQVTLTVTRGGRRVLRTVTSGAPGRTYRLALAPRRRGAYRVRLTAESGGARVTSTLTARRL